MIKTTNEYKGRCYMNDQNKQPTNEQEEIQKQNDLNDQESNEEVTNPTEPTSSKQKKRKPKSGFFNMIAASVIGSVLTLGVVTQTDLLQVEPIVQEVEKDTPVSGTTNMVADEGDVADMIEQSSEAIVGITNIGKQQDPFQQSTEDVEKGTGSGVIYEVTDGEAYIVTNHHVIDGANKVNVSLYNGETVEATLVGTDPLTDIAVVKVSEVDDITTLPFGDSDAVRSGESVMAIGNPLGLDLSRTVTQGIVSAIDRSINVKTAAGDWDLDVIQTDAAINPGNSGGALINGQGRSEERRVGKECRDGG